MQEKIGYKVMLINPYHKEWGHGVPLGIAYLAGVLEKYDIDVKVLDMCASKISMDELLIKIVEYSPNLVGLSITTPQIPISYEIAQIVKDYSRHIKNGIWWCPSHLVAR